jgi:hypothetical protein
VENQRKKLHKNPPFTDTNNKVNGGFLCLDMTANKTKHYNEEKII